MIDTLRIFDDLKETLEPDAARKITDVITLIYEDLQNIVTKAEFNELKDVVKDLAAAQKRTEQRVEELGAAQQRTEQRLEQLAAAQQRTEQRLEQLAAAQQRTEQRVDDLTKALIKLTEEHRETRRQLGGLSMTVGYSLEYKAYKALPGLLKRDYNLQIRGKLTRQYVRDKDGNDLEVNIVGKASSNGKEFFIIGEGKSQLSKNDIDNFIRRKLNRFTGVCEKIFPIVVTYMITSPDVEQYAREKGIALYYSYDF